MKSCMHMRVYIINVYSLNNNNIHKINIHKTHRLKTKVLPVSSLPCISFQSYAPKASQIQYPELNNNHPLALALNNVAQKHLYMYWLVLFLLNFIKRDSDYA